MKRFGCLLILLFYYFRPLLETMYKKLTLLLLSGILFTQCKQKPSHFIHDHWLMPKDLHEMTFKDDSTMTWIIKQQFLVDTFNAHYKLDDTKNPKWIDLFQFDKGLMRGKILTGIYETYGHDTLLLDFQPVEDWVGADTSRPKEFNEIEKRFLVRQHK